jgi:hypothetical protein
MQIMLYLYDKGKIIVEKSIPIYSFATQAYLIRIIRIKYDVRNDNSIFR